MTLLVKIPLTPIPVKLLQAVLNDLFNPLPDQCNVLLAWHNFNRFPASKIVNFTSCQHVLLTLEKIYINFNYPECYKCDNESPFNKQGFLNWSTKRCIRIKTTYPYNSLRNKAECFMKPLKMSIQIVFDKNRPIQEAIDELQEYHSTAANPRRNLAYGEVVC